MKKLDEEILEVETRIARRRMAVDLTARAAWHRTVSKVFSPACLVGAAALGFVTVAAVFRRRPKIVERRSSGRAASKWGGLLGIGTSLALSLAKSQYGGPLQMAQMVLGQVKAFKERKKKPATSADFRSGAVAR